MLFVIYPDIFQILLYQKVCSFIRTAGHFEISLMVLATGQQLVLQCCLLHHDLPLKGHSAALSACCLCLLSFCVIFGLQGGSDVCFCLLSSWKKERQSNYCNYSIYSDDPDVLAFLFFVIYDAIVAQGASIKHYTNVKAKSCVTCEYADELTLMF